MIMLFEHLVIVLDEHKKKINKRTVKTCITIGVQI